MLIRFGMIQQEKGKRYRTIRNTLLPSEARRLAARFREREERGKLKQHQMLEYAESRSCRWQVLLDYFGNEEVLDRACGRCDRCSGG
jgi:ATP-dependent DNA helicase RecQ